MKICYVYNVWQKEKYVISFEMEEKILEKKDLANSTYQNLILMYESYKFPALSEISDLDSKGCYKEIGLSEVFEWIQEV